MAVHFPVDIEHPRRRVGWGFPILGLLVLAAFALGVFLTYMVIAIG